jgi:hypothetical protein
LMITVKPRVTCGYSEYGRAYLPVNTRENNSHRIIEILLRVCVCVVSGARRA